MKRTKHSDPALARITSSPRAFDGTLEDLFDQHVARNLPTPSVVARFHAELVRYLGSDDPLFLVRAVRSMERGMSYTSADGLRFRPTDNSPAWCVLTSLVTRDDTASAFVEFAAFVGALPSEMFAIRRDFGSTIASLGWHVAHLFPAKNGHTDYEQWNRDELARRFVRNIHPCNLFLLPKADWRSYGDDQPVLAFVASRYRERYAEVWDEFLVIAGATEPAASTIKPVAYRFDEGQSGAPAKRRSFRISGAGGAACTK